MLLCCCTAVTVLLLLCCCCAHYFTFYTHHLSLPGPCPLFVSDYVAPNVSHLQPLTCHCSLTAAGCVQARLVLVCCCSMLPSLQPSQPQSVALCGNSRRGASLWQCCWRAHCWEERSGTFRGVVVEGLLWELHWRSLGDCLLAAHFLLLAAYLLHTRCILAAYLLRTCCLLIAYLLLTYCLLMLQLFARCLVSACWVCTCCLQMANCLLLVDHLLAVHLLLAEFLHAAHWPLTCCILAESDIMSYDGITFMAHEVVNWILFLKRINDSMLNHLTY